MFASSLLSLAAEAGPTVAPGTPVSVVVTAGSKHGKAIPTLSSDDLTVAQGRDKRPVLSVQPLASAKLQLLLMIDDSAGAGFDTQIQSLKSFVTTLPTDAEVGVSYMRNGMAQMTANFTLDHAAAAQAIRMPLGPGGADVSPYDSLKDAVSKWPNSQNVKREIIMISSGLDGLGGGLTSDNPYVNSGIEAVQKVGIVVYTIYSPSVGHAGRSFYRGNWGQSFLTMLSDRTDGQFFGLGLTAPVSIEPYLKEIIDAQQHQYLLTFVARAEPKAGLQDVQIKLTEKDANLAAPNKVFVRAGL